MKTSFRIDGVDLASNYASVYSAYYAFRLFSLKNKVLNLTNINIQVSGIIVYSTTYANAYLQNMIVDGYK